MVITSVRLRDIERNRESGSERIKLNERNSKRVRKLRKRVKCEKKSKERKNNCEQCCHFYSNLLILTSSMCKCADFSWLFRFLVKKCNCERDGL